MDVTKVLAELSSMMVARLFGERPWLTDRELSCALRQRLIDLGLQIPVDTKTTQSTPLGRELNLDLIMVFLGYRCEFEVLWILEEHGLAGC
jgi:hypothetical protein